MKDSLDKKNQTYVYLLHWAAGPKGLTAVRMSERDQDGHLWEQEWRDQQLKQCLQKPELLLQELALGLYLQHEEKNVSTTSIVKKSMQSEQKKAT